MTFAVSTWSTHPIAVSLFAQIQHVVDESALFAVITSFPHGVMHVISKSVIIVYTPLCYNTTASAMACNRLVRR